MRKDLSKGLWNRTGKNEMGARKYALILGLAFFWAILVTSFGTWVSYGWGAVFLVSLIGFIGAIIGIGMYSGSDEPGTSILGVTVLSFSLGITIGPIIAYYDAELILRALIITAMVTFVMSALGILLPKVMKEMGGVLLLGLTFLLVAYFAQFILAIFGTFPRMGAIDWLAAGLFSLYIWYDWSRAMHLPQVLNNAIDAAGALIVDVVNLFLVVLRIVARSQ